MTKFDDAAEKLLEQAGLRPTVVEAFAAVMADVQAVGKDGRNESQGYSFRGIDGVMNAVGPALRKHGVVVSPRVLTVAYREVEVGQRRTLQRECTIEVEYTVRGPAGDTFTGSAAAEALDSGDKATSKAHSVAYRTFLLQALTIPTHEPDPDLVSVERSPRVPERPKATDDDKALLRDRIAVLDAETKRTLGTQWKAELHPLDDLHADELERATALVVEAESNAPAPSVDGEGTP